MLLTIYFDIVTAFYLVLIFLVVNFVAIIVGLAVLFNSRYGKKSIDVNADAQETWSRRSAVLDMRGAPRLESRENHCPVCDAELLGKLASCPICGTLLG